MARIFVGLIALLTAVAGPLSSPVYAADSGRSGIRVERAWARASIGTSRPAAAYLTLVNAGKAQARLVAIETPVAERTEVHRTVKQGEVMRMQPAGNVPVPAGERVVFAPGGLHVMLMDLRQPLDKGGTFPLTLRFADGNAIELAVPILGPGARGPEE